MSACSLPIPSRLAQLWGMYREYTFNPSFNSILNSELDVWKIKDQAVFQSRCGNLPATTVYGSSQAVRCSSNVCQNASMASGEEFQQAF
ncbi:hypothetical protein MA16_Dca028702 [Dendrobium catenatum]|uniref:Uncharacterized protein n=1 Tax=Dendrobium catenatum TaxID=906689 RepID=A0A2I0VHM0_9ASPA|nr:hypothetical protein MA16_Dca028702 [Dendrobium catenatum]